MNTISKSRPTQLVTELQCYFTQKALDALDEILKEHPNIPRSYLIRALVSVHQTAIVDTELFWELEKLVSAGMTDLIVGPKKKVNVRIKPRLMACLKGAYYTPSKVIESRVISMLSVRFGREERHREFWIRHLQLPLDAVLKAG